MAATLHRKEFSVIWTLREFTGVNRELTLITCGKETQKEDNGKSLS